MFGARTGVCVCVYITPQINWLTWMNRGGTGRVADG